MSIPCLLNVIVVLSFISSVCGQDSADRIISALTDHKDVCGDRKWQVISPGTGCGMNDPCEYKRFWCAEESGTLVCVQLSPACQEFLPDVPISITTAAPNNFDTTVFPRTSAPFVTMATVVTSPVTVQPPVVPTSPQQSGLITLFCGGCQCDCPCGMAPPCSAMPSGQPSPVSPQRPNIITLPAGQPGTGALPSTQTGTGTVSGSQPSMITVPSSQPGTGALPNPQSPNIITLPSPQSVSCASGQCGQPPPCSASSSCGQQGQSGCSSPSCGQPVASGCSSPSCGQQTSGCSSCGNPAPPPLVEGVQADAGPTGCTNYHRRCNAWAARGECGQNARYMYRNCRSSCGGCRFRIL